MNKREYLTDYCGRTHCGHCSLSFDFACPLLLFSNWDVTPDEAVDKTISLLQEAGEIPSNLDTVTVKTPTAPTAVTVKLTELTDECIERIAEAVAKKLKANPRENKVYTSSVAVAPVKYGKWIRREIGWKCSNCNLVTNNKGVADFNYCPNCGADMRERKKECD